MNKTERKKYIEEIVQRDEENETKKVEILDALMSGDISTFLGLIKSIKIPGVKFSMHRHNIYQFINNYTRGDLSDEFKEQNIRDLLVVKNIYGAAIGEDYVKLDLKEGITAEVYSLHNVIPSLKDDKVVQTLNRQGKCHEMSLRLLGQVSNSDARVVTGEIAPLYEGMKFLHSWIEIGEGEETYVLDYTMNAMVSKDGYYTIMGAQPKTTISKQQYARDLEVMRPYLEQDKVNIKEYLVFPKETIVDLRNEIRQPK